MSGKPGQMHRQPKAGTDRRLIWQSMRILKRFTLPDLMRTSGAGLDNAKKFAAALTRHGYLRDNEDWRRGEPGSFKSWSLRINPGPDYPLVCARCGRPITSRECVEPANQPSAISDQQSEGVGHDGK